MVVIQNRVRVVVVSALAASLLTLVLLEKPAQAQAEPITSIDQSTFNQAFLSCTGELVFIEGTSHTVTHTTIDASGVLHTEFHFNIQGRGESASGAKYVFQDTFTLHENFQGGAPTYNVTFTGAGKLIRQGSATPTDDRGFTLLLHQTLNAQGELVSVVVKPEEPECT